MDIQARSVCWKLFKGRTVGHQCLWMLTPMFHYTAPVPKLKCRDIFQLANECHYLTHSVHGHTLRWTLFQTSWNGKITLFSGISGTCGSFLKRVETHFTASSPFSFRSGRTPFHQVFHYYGIAEDIVSDRGSQFISRVWRAFIEKLGITVSLTSGYHPQTNGQAERSN